MKKTCFKCGELKELSEFYDHSQMSDGHLGKCKECARKDVHENRVTKRKQYSEYERLRRKRPEGYLAAKQREHRAANPDKYKARMVVSNAIRDGRLTREPCMYCGNPKSQAHHEDYSNPLEVTWVCFKCHRERIHNQTVTIPF